MKRTYSLFQQYIACILFISVFLQSCGGSNNAIIPIQDEPTVRVQTDAQVFIPQTNTLPLIGQELVAQGGHTVTFHEEAGELKADVVVSAPQGFSKSYEGINVYVEQEAELASLSQLDAKAQQRRIQLHPATSNQPAKVVIYKKAGIVGGMLEGEEEPSSTTIIEQIQQQKQRLIEQQEGNTLPTIMPELWQEIFSHLDFKGVLTARAVSTDWNKLITGLKQLGVVGVENKPFHIINTSGWIIKREINFSEGKLIQIKPEAIPSFAFYRLIGRVKDLPQKFWPYIKHTNIHTVYIHVDEYDNYLNAQDAIEFAKYLQGTNVHTAVFENSRMGSQSAIEFVKYLQGTNVCEVDLGGSCISPQGAEGIAKHLQGTRVHTIHLNGNNLSDQGAVILAKHLQGTRVHTVDLAWNGISAQGAIEFAKHLQETQVHTVNFIANQISPDVRKLLVEQYPHIKWIC